MRHVLVLVLAVGCGDSFEGPCGNGHLDPAETCDDGNIVSGDRCSTNCLREPTCGDRVIDPGENCDDGNVAPGDNCDEQCRTETECGDFDIEPGETCEDGNSDSGDGCSSTCKIEYRVTAQVSWKFVLADDVTTDRGCPVGFDTVEVTTQALRDDNSPHGAPVVERFACADHVAEIRRFASRYHVRLRATDAMGTSTYATSLEATTDLRSAQRDVRALFIQDGGYAQLAWRLVDPVTRQAQSCTDAGVFDMSVVATSPTFTRAGFALCSTGHAITQPLPAGDYTLRLVALDSIGDEIGDTSVAVTIGAPGVVLDVGTVEFSIPR